MNLRFDITPYADGLAVGIAGTDCEGAPIPWSTVVDTIVADCGNGHPEDVANARRTALAMQAAAALALTRIERIETHNAVQEAGLG